MRENEGEFQDQNRSIHNLSKEQYGQLFRLLENFQTQCGNAGDVSGSVDLNSGVVSFAVLNFILVRSWTCFSALFLRRNRVKQKEIRTKEFSALGWWRENEKQFPVLSAMARDVLNVPISTVASESAFSQARQQLGDTCHSLGSNALEVLVCFRDWIRSERRNQGREDVDSPEDEELGDILTHGNPSEFNTPEEGQSVHIDYEELTRAMQNL